MSWKHLPIFVHMHEFFKKDLSKTDSPMEEISPEQANLVSSVYYRNDDTVYHRPVLDIDMACVVLPSTTPGHHHLFIDKVMTAEDYEKLLSVLVEVGIIQKGIWDLQWKQDGQTAARLPHIKKEPKDVSSAETKSNDPLADWEAELLGKNVNMLTFDASAEINDASEKPVNILPDFGETELVSSIDNAIESFEKLAAIATKTGHSLNDVVTAWKKFGGIE